MLMDVVNYISHVSVFMLCAWNAGYNHYFDPKALMDYVDAWAVNPDNQK